MSLKLLISNGIGRAVSKTVLRETVRSERVVHTVPTGVAVPVLAGLFTGFVSGMVGLGGAELRLPFLLYLLGVPVREMVTLNLLVSLITSGSSFLVRWQSGLLSISDLPLSLGMIVGSLGGGYIGAIISHRVTVKKLKAFLAVILSVAIVRLVVELFAEGGAARVFPYSLELPLVALFGFGIGLVAGATGVAGGEYRIPTLMYLFGSPIKIAGTISQLVSVPTIMIAILKHNQYGALGRQTIRIALLMGGGSLVGVLLSGLFLASISDVYIKTLFILILTYTVVRLVQDLRVSTGG